MIVAGIGAEGCRLGVGRDRSGAAGAGLTLPAFHAGDGAKNAESGMIAAAER